MRSRSFLRISRPLRCCSLVPTMPTKTVADCRSPANPTSLTVINPASPVGISRRMISPISRFSNSRTRWCRSDCMAPSVRKSKLLGHLFQRVTFDNVAHLEIVEAIQPDAALDAGADFADFVLKTPQRGCDAFENEALASLDSHLALDNATAGDDTASDIAALGEGKHLP